MSWWEDIGDWLSGNGGASDAAGPLLGSDYTYGDVGSGLGDALTSAASGGANFGTQALADSANWDAGSLLDADTLGALGQFASSLGGATEYKEHPAVTQYGPGISNTAGYAQRQGVGESNGPGVFGKLLQGLGIQNKEGQIDYSDPRVMDKILRTVVAGGNIVSALAGPRKPRGYKSAAELRAELAGPFNNWTPAQATAVRGYFDAPVAARRRLAPVAGGPSPIVPGQKFADGGGLPQPDDSQPTFHSTGALSALVTGPGGGQDDLVSARLGPGEYVFDADVVSALGDGSNDRGAELLDKWRVELRQHKRSAPPTKIPPRAKAPGQYLKQAKAG